MTEKWDDPNKVGGKYMAGVIADFAPALKEIAKLGSMNNKPNGKYERGSWKLVENPEVEYNDAFWRHILEGPHEIDSETSMPHDVAIAWNALALVCFRLEREKGEVKDPNLPTYAAICSLCTGRLNGDGGCVNPNCSLYEYKTYDGAFCPLCKFPLTNGLCMNATCEEVK